MKAPTSTQPRRRTHRARSAGPVRATHHLRPARLPGPLRVFCWLGAWLLLAVHGSPTNGVSTTLPTQVKRVVSLVPAATEALFEIGAGSRVVAVSSFDTWPPEVLELPKVGALIDPDLERILSLQPDLVVVDPSQPALVVQLRTAGIDSIPYGTATIADMLRDMRQLATRIGLEAQGRLVAELLETQLEELRGRYARAAAPTVLMVFGRSTGSFANLYVNGGVGFLNEIVEIAGGRNLFADVERQSFKAGLETLFSRVPDVVIELRSARSGPVDMSTIERDWRALPGFAGARVGAIVSDALLIPGPRLPDSVRRIAELLHSE